MPKKTLFFILSIFLLLSCNEPPMPTEKETPKTVEKEAPKASFTKANTADLYFGLAKKRDGNKALFFDNRNLDLLKHLEKQGFATPKHKANAAQHEEGLYYRSTANIPLLALTDQQVKEGKMVEWKLISTREDECRDSTSLNPVVEIGFEKPFGNKESEKMLALSNYFPVLIAKAATLNALELKPSLAKEQSLSFEEKTVAGLSLDTNDDGLADLFWYWGEWYNDIYRNLHLLVNVDGEFGLQYVYRYGECI